MKPLHLGQNHGDFEVLMTVLYLERPPEPVRAATEIDVLSASISVYIHSNDAIGELRTQVGNELNVLSELVALKCKSAVSVSNKIFRIKVSLISAISRESLIFQKHSIFVRK
jgi:hypothetical protein